MLKTSTDITNIYFFDSYRTFLVDWLFLQPKRGRGIRRQMAGVLRCHSGFITKVFQGECNFSPEQAHDLFPLLDLNEKESRYFLLLVMKERASSTSLKNFYQKEIQLLRQEGLKLKEEIQRTGIDSLQDQIVYYSHWYYSAVHTCLSISNMRTPKEIADFLGLSKSRVKRVLLFLEKVGLAHKSFGKFVPGKTNLHLDSDSPLLARHHSNWRNLAMEKLEDNNNIEALHYSSVISLSKKDLSKARAILFKAIQDVRELVGKSGDETVACYNLDLFPLNDRSEY